ncbi:MAG TPA: SulP family inorganic anion transporter [Gemmatimonadaceae bacterium]
MNPTAAPRRTPALMPKLVTTLKGYDRQQFLRDVGAGAIVGVVALPLAIAFAIASGVTPDRGLWTAIVAGLIISVLGGSRVQIGGPTGAFVVIVYAIVQKYGVDGLIVATFMAGILLIAFGIARFGVAIKFIPHPVVIGFTSGIAVVIFSGEIKDLLGLEMGAVPPGFIEKWMAYGAASGMSIHAVLLAALSFVILVFWPRISRRIPAPLVALLVATALANILHLNVETIGSRFGPIDLSIPTPHVPEISLAQAMSLVGPAFAIALLGGIESLMSAVISDGMIGGRHRSNMELVAQGVANIASASFGGIPATGAIARTATNVKNGGRTPVAGIVHSVTLLIITAVFGMWASAIPMAVLAAILTVVAYHMSEWRSFVAELTSPRSDIVVMLTTFALTVLVDITVAIEVGVVLSAFLFIKRMSEVTNVSAITRELAADNSDDDEEPSPARGIPRGVEVYEVNGPFFFGAAERFKETLSTIASKPRVLIIRMRHVLALDSTGMHALKEVVHRSRREGTLVLLSGVHMQPLVALTGSAVLNELGKENLYGTFDEALERARQHVGSSSSPVETGDK